MVSTGGVMKENEPEGCVQNNVAFGDSVENNEYKFEVDWPASPSAPK